MAHVERSLVFDALERASENGYADQLRKCTPLTVAIDLCDLDTDFSETDPLDLIQHVEAWQRAQLSTKLNEI